MQCRTPAPSVQRPHILHMVVDDLGNEDLGFQNPQVSSPNIDSLRKCGVVLDHFYAPKACAPSRASIMTGRYPFRVGIYSNADVDTNGVPTNFSFLPELLRREGGYATHAVGKWHLGYRALPMTPTYRGFDSFFGFWHCCSDYFTHMYPDGGLDQVNASGISLAADRSHGSEYSALLYASVASKIIRLHPKDRPLYLYLAFQSVHGPYQVPDRYRDAQRGAHPKWSSNRQIYAGMIAAMDSAVGHVLRALRGAKLWESSLVILMSDNGGALGIMCNKPFRGGKFTLWEGGIRIPFLMSGPLMHRVRSSTWSGMAHTADLLPTLLSAANLRAANMSDTGPFPLDGISIWGAIIRNSSSPRKEIVHQVVSRWNPRDCLGADHDAQNCGASIRIGRYKLLVGYPGDDRDTDAARDTPAWTPDYIRYPRNASLMPRWDGCSVGSGTNCRCWRGVCLFDVVLDPGERQDLSKALPRVVARLARRLVEISARATQGRAQCAESKKADQIRARTRMEGTGGVHMPFADEIPWLNNVDAPSCYNAWHAGLRKWFGIASHHSVLQQLLNMSILDSL